MDCKIILVLLLILLLVIKQKTSSFTGIQEILNDKYTSCDIPKDNNLVPRGKLPAGNYLGFNKIERENLLKNFINNGENNLNNLF